MDVGPPGRASGRAARSWYGLVARRQERSQTTYRPAALPVLRSATVMRPGHFFLLALLIGFLSYRVALATFPSEQMWVPTPEGRAGTHFDAVTGMMVLPPSGFYSYPESGMIAHWYRSALFGLAVVPLAFIALWWLGRRRRRDLPAG
jgi:hypothetical protein